MLASGMRKHVCNNHHRHCTPLGLAFQPQFALGRDGLGHLRDFIRLQIAVAIMIEHIEQIPPTRLHILNRDIAGLRHIP